MSFPICRAQLIGIVACLSTMLSAPFALGQDMEPVAGLSYYGNLNQGILQYDDGVETINYGRVDNAVNDNVNRFGIVYNQSLSSGWNLTGTFELGLAPKPSDQLSQTDQNNSGWQFDDQGLRKFEVSFSNARFGTFHIGQGNMSGQGPGPDDSGTGVIASSNPANLAGGNFWRASTGGALTTRRLNDSFDNFDTGRRFRARYDSPSYRGFSVSTSLGREILTGNDHKTYFDLVGKYTRDWRTISFTTELGLNGLGDNDFAGRVGFSIIHLPSGINLSGSGSHSTIGPHFGYIKLGLIRDLFSFGSTAISYDLYNGGRFPNDKAESISNGFAIVQRIDALNMEIFASVRTFEGYTNSGTASENFMDSKAIIAGLNWKF